jgi:signal transduction histidine kinase
VVVKDTGKGVGPATTDRIFERFFTTKPDGMGMRFSICRSIIDTHGGRFWVSPCTPCGTVFRFTMPAYRQVHCHSASEFRLLAEGG